MAQDSVIYQRTHDGREEIRCKSHGLTQSERLVLIMVDGAASVRELRAKLPVLGEERFHRALAKLEKSGLILEVMLPLDEPPRDEIEKSVIDRFLEQDPLDPLTVLMLNPEEDDEDWKLAPAASSVPRPSVPQPFAMDEAEIRIADSVTEEVQARQEARAPRLEPIEFATRTIIAQERAREERQKQSGWRSYLPYVVLLIGVAFIAGFALARFTV